MKRKIIIATTILCLSEMLLLVTACGVNSDINHDDYHRNDDNDNIVNLSDCNSLFNNDDLSYSYLTVTKEKIALNILSILKYNIRSIIQTDYSIAFTTKDGNPVANINLVNNYNIILTATQNSKHLKGNLTLNLSIIDDRTDISKINYHENNWYLSSRNTIADLFTKFEMAIYLTVHDARYNLGDFLKITIQHQDTFYTNTDKYSDEVLDINGNYIISATTESQNIINSFIIGSLDNLIIFASDQRQTVANLSNKIFNDYHPDNLTDNGKTLYNGIRNIINNLYTLDTTTQSDFDIVIKDNDIVLNNDEAKLTSLNYQITIDATNSKYLKDINVSLTINIIDKVIHLENLSIDTTTITPNIATQAKTLKANILSQISIAAKFPGTENYLIVNLTQNGSEIINDNQYLDPTNVQINVIADQTITTQYFGGKLKLNLFVIDNRIDLQDTTTANAITKAISKTGYSTLNSLNDVKSSILTIIKAFIQESNPDINENLALSDLDITLAGYANDPDQLHETTNISLIIKANNNSRYIKNELKLIKININYVREQGSFTTVAMTPITFVDYDDNANSHIMTQIDETTIAIYNQDLTTVKYSINYSQSTNTILDYKISHDGAHDFWVIQTKIDENHFQIDYYIDNKIVATNIFAGYAIIATINKYSQTLYVRPDITKEHTGIGNLYLMSANQKAMQVDLSQINITPFEIDLIRSSETASQVYIQSKNQIYAINEGISAIESIIESYDISNDYFFDYDNQNNIYQLRKDGLYCNNELINPIKPNPNLLYNINDYNYKFISNFTVDQENNFYYLYRDNVNNKYSVVKNQEVLFTVTDKTSLNQYLKVLPSGIWELTIGSKIYTNNRGN